MKSWPAWILSPQGALNEEISRPICCMVEGDGREGGGSCDK